jgi:hypothetical protein
VGTMNLSISIRVAETWYGVVTVSAGDEVFIFLDLWGVSCYVELYQSLWLR